VTQEHDRDERRQLEPEVDVDQTELGRDRGTECDEQSQRDQQHHAWLPRLQLLPAATKEDRAAPQEHERPEERRHEGVAGELRRGVAQPVLDHVAVQHRRNGQREAHPEPATEHLGVITVIGVLTVTIVTGVVLVRPLHERRPPPPFYLRRSVTALCVGVAAAGDVAPRRR
jgi:hypothetical protein